MKDSLLATIGYALIFLSVFGLTETFRHRYPHLKELSRKMAHILCGLVSISFPYFIQSHWVVLGFVIIFSILMLISKQNRFLTSIHKVGRKSYGSFYYPLAIYIVFLLASQKPAIYLISMLTMTFSDAFAALIGKKYGSVKYEVEGNVKSLEGSIIFLVVTFLCVHIPLIFLTDIGSANAVLVALIMSIVLTGFEAISPTGSDNILVPIGTCFLLWKLTYLPLEIIVQDIYILLFVVAITAFLSMLKPSGLIGVMLLNYAAITLASIDWLVPLLLAEFLFYSLVMSMRKEQPEKYPLRILFYMGIIPLSFIFIENLLHMKTVIFVPYLVSIASQLPISYRLAKFGPERGAYAVAAILFIVVPSMLVYLGRLDGTIMLLISVSTLLVYLVNRLFHKYVPVVREDKREFRFRFISTALGAAFAFAVAYHQGVGS